jgi:hypothetical protein
MPRPFVQLTPEPVVPVESGAGGGTPGVSIEQAGTPIPNNPHTILNLTGSVTAADAGSGVATINITGGGGFTDNATTLRTRKQPFLRRNDLLASNTPISPGYIFPANLGISVLTDYLTQVAGIATCFIGDKFFYVGYSKTPGALVGIDLFVPQSVMSGSLTNYGDTPVDLIGIRGQTGTVFPSPQDNIFGAFPNGLFVECGTINGTPPNMYYVQSYHTATTSAPVRACFIGGGGGDPVLSTTPQFAFSATNGHIYIVDSVGTIHDAFTTGDAPNAMFLDDAGFLWVAYNTSQSLVKFSINFSTYSLTQVSTIATGVTALDMISDGRFARILASNSGIPTIYAWDLTSGNAGPVIPLPASGDTVSFSSPRDLFYDAPNDNVWVADQKLGTAVSIKAATQAGDLAVDLTAIGNGASRVIGDSNYVYISNGFGFDRYLIIVNKTTGAIVGMLDAGAGLTVQDQTLDGAGNIYIVASNYSSLTSSNIQKYSIATALSSYPSAIGPSVTSPVQRGYHACAYDPVTGTVFAGTQNETGVTESLVKLNTSTLVEISHFDFPGTGSAYPCIQFVLAAAGSIWASTGSVFSGYSGNLFRVDPTAFPAGGAFTNIVTSTSTSSALSYDATFGTILVGDESESVSRVSTSTNLEVSTWVPPIGGNSSAVITPTAIWVTVADFPTRGLFRYTTGVGTETQIGSEISSVTIPAPFGGRLVWDGVSIYASIGNP